MILKLRIDKMMDEKEEIELWIWRWDSGGIETDRLIDEIMEVIK